MEPSSLLMKMLQSEEGCHKFIGPDQYKAYEDGGNFSIGYGCQQYFDEAGEPYVKDGDVITLDKAQKMLKKGVVKYQNAVEKKLNDNGVVLEQHQKDALTCFCYNIGIGGFNGCDLIKTIIKSKGKKEFITKQDIRKQKIINIARLAIIVLSIAFIIHGTYNGGASDVYQKAINICTECIGLG